MSLISVFFRLVVSMAVVLALMGLAAAMMRRRGGFTAPSRKAQIEVIGRQPLGRTSSVAIVRAGSRTLLLGVTDTHVSLLAETTAEELEIDIEAPGTASAGPNGSFPTWKTFVDTMRERTVRRS